VLVEERPDAVLILGDTNSALAGIIARRMKIPLYHMEAGNRSFDFNVPEEINRRIIDHISGSPMREVLDDNRAGLAASDVLERLELTPGQFFVVSMHRAENVDVQAHLLQLLEALDRLRREFGWPIIVSTHPRTRQRLESLGHVGDEHIRFLPPFGYHDYLRLQTEAFCTLSDSGTISEEASILGFPAVTMRNAIERPEALDSGHISLTGLDPASILRSVQFVTTHRDQDRHRPIAEEYEIRNTSTRVVKLILGTPTLGRRWDTNAAA
jgi:UDP-N-acetylglucosamine 2-epimerase (non-hydrolysing)